MHSVNYTTSDGTAYDLQDAEVQVLGSTDLSGWEWSVDSSTGATSREARQYSCSWVVFDAEVANDLMRRADGDAKARTPGTLAVDGWRLSCYVLSGALGSYNRRQRVYTLTFYAPEPVWRRSTAYHLLPYTGTQTDDSLDYPHDYGHDYGGALGSYGIHAITSEGPCLLGITFFGACVNPYCRVRTADGTTNTYGVNASADIGERIVIDPLGRRVVGGSVYKVNTYGESTNLFDARLRGSEGSGSYVFQSLPAGTMTVSWPQSYGVDIDVIEERGQLPWT